MKLKASGIIRKKTRTYDNTGMASWYGPKFDGRRTANGEIFDMDLLTAAHPTLPMPIRAKVTNLENGKSVIVRINDRGPFAKNREIDMSRRAAEVLGFREKGTASRVRVQYLGVRRFTTFGSYHPQAGA